MSIPFAIKNRAPTYRSPAQCYLFEKRTSNECYMRCGEEMPKMPNVVDMTIRVASHRAKRAFLRFSSSTLSTGQFV